MIENELTKDFVPQGSSVTRIKQMIEYLSKYGVHAKWQAGKLGPEFVLIDEIISKIINHQPLSDLILSKTMACLLRKALNSPD
ncbi:MAG: hypothetical protein NTZ74_06290 [Chloroflexi bacterium]|nr:hypothetical protein [Chloroflexota bacterium]